MRRRKAIGIGAAFSQLDLYRSEVKAMRLKPEEIARFDSLTYWSGKLTTNMRPLALQAIRVEIPRIVVAIVIYIPQGSYLGTTIFDR